MTKKHDCYNCGTNCSHRMIDGCGSATPDSVARRKEVHNGKKCEDWTEYVEYHSDGSITMG